MGRRSRGGFDGGDSDLLGRFPTMMRFRSLRAIGGVAHASGEIGGKLRGGGIGLGAIQDVHFAGEDRGNRRELTTGSAFLLVDRRMEVIGRVNGGG